MSLKKNITISLLTSIMIFNPVANLAHANEVSVISELNLLRIKIENDIEKNGIANNDDMLKLENIISSLEDQTKPENIQRGGSWIDLGKGYRMRLDTPEHNGNPKYHVHVYKGNKEIASENADGSASHGKNGKILRKNKVSYLKQQDKLRVNILSLN